MAKVKPLLGPLGDEYELEDGVSRLNHWFEEVKVTHALDDGSERYYHKGFIFRATLTFSSMTQAQYDGLKDEYDRHTELRFYPNPQEYPNTSFEVRWTNPFNFVYAYAVRTDRYQGTIELRGTEVFTEIPNFT